MSRVVGLLLCIGMFAVGGCALVTSKTTSPIYDPAKDAHFDSRLVGTWLPATFCVQLQPGPGKSYITNANLLMQLTGMDPSRPVNLVRIGKYDYLIAAPVAGESGTSLTGMCRIEYRDDMLIIETLKLQAVVYDLETHPGTLKHEFQSRGMMIAPMTQPTTAASAPSTQPDTAPGAVPDPELGGGNLTITDTPAAIRAYLISHQDDPGFFNEPTVLMRIR